IRSEVGGGLNGGRGIQLTKPEMHADQQTTTGKCAYPNEVAPIHLGIMFHFAPPSVVRTAASSAARRTPARMRKYDAQRHRLLPIARSMSPSFGCGLLLSNAAAVMICPAWQ